MTDTESAGLLPDSLWPFIKHDSDCALEGHWMEASDCDCTCGLNKALDGLKALTRTPTPSADMVEVERLREAALALLQFEGHQVWCAHPNDMSKPCVCGYIVAQDALRVALSRHPEGK